MNHLAVPMLYRDEASTANYITRSPTPVAGYLEFNHSEQSEEFLI